MERNAHSLHRAMGLMLVLASSLLGVGRARAEMERKVECMASRSECEDVMLQVCPGGATVLSEDLRAVATSAQAQVRRYLLRYRCGAAAASDSADREHAAWVERMRAKRRRLRLGPAIGLLVGGTAVLSLGVYGVALPGSSWILPAAIVGSLGGAVAVGSAILLRRTVRARREIDLELQQYASRRFDLSVSGSRVAVVGRFLLRF